jgi:dolichol-phosphate mannosyltransferase
MKFDMTVLVPTFNEKENVKNMINAVDTICKENFINEEIIVVDDNSTDGTIQIVKSMMDEYPNLRILVRYSDPGLSQSLYFGMMNAESDLVQCVDCDFSHPVEKIPELYRLAHSGYDIAVGSRYVKDGGTVDWPLKRQIISFAAALIGRLLIPCVADSGSGFFLINRKILENTHLTPRGFRMSFEILGKAHWNTVSEIPIMFKDRERGTSKLRFKIVCEYVIQYLSILRYNFIDRKGNNIIKAWKLFLNNYL